MTLRICTFLIDIEEAIRAKIKTDFKELKEKQIKELLR